MGFLKRIFGRSKWEQVADDVDTMEPIWESVPPAEPEHGAGVVAPSPRFQPGITPAAAPPPRFQPGITPASTPPPRSEKGGAPGSPVEPPSGPGLRSTARSADVTREVIIDTVAEDDLTMPEEFRGCRVVERTGSDGTVEILYRGPGGFTVDEATADLLIAVYKDELSSVPTKAAVPTPGGSYAAPTGATRAVEPRLVGPGSREIVSGGGLASTSEELIDELGAGVELPPDLRGARFVRRAGEFLYVTRGGACLSKDQAESMMEEWDARRIERQASSPLVIDELGLGEDLPPELRGAKFVNDGNEFLYIARGGTRYSKDMAEGMMERWERDESDRARAQLKVSAPQPDLEVPWASSSGPSPGHSSGSAIGPSTATPEPEIVGSSIGDALKKRAESGLLPAPAVQAPAPGVQAPPLHSTPAPRMTPAPHSTPAPRMTPAPHSTPAPIGADPRFPLRAVAAPEDPTQETPLDNTAVADSQRIAELIRSRVLEDEDAAYQTKVPAARLQQACQSEIDRKRARHRFEHMLDLSARAREAIGEAWRTSSDRKLRDAAKDLEQDMMLLGLFNPMTMREIDLAEFLSVSRLRASERRRNIVTGEVARRVGEQAPADLHQFCMTRAFVDRVAQAAMESPSSPGKVVEAVLTARLAESVQSIVTEVTRRHGIWLPGLADRLVSRLSPIVRGLVKLANPA